MTRLYARKKVNIPCFLFKRIISLVTFELTAVIERDRYAVSCVTIVTKVAFHLISFAISSCSRFVAKPNISREIQGPLFKESYDVQLLNKIRLITLKGF